MCGRYSLSVREQRIQQEVSFVENGFEVEANYNIAPTQQAVVVANDDPRHLQSMQWGLIPFWSREGKNSGRLINARSEGVEEKPSFRQPIRKRRCLVLADSFYEWRNKVPYRILPADGALLVMAGIWDIWESRRTFSILTTSPNREVSALHDRMPVILPDNALRERWLEDIPLEEVLSYLHPAPDGYFRIYQVPTLVNSVRNNSPELHEAVKP